MICTNDVVEWVFFLVKNFILKQVITRLRRSANEMPVYFTTSSDYTKICFHKNIRQRIDASGYNTNMVGRQYNLLPYMITNKRTMATSTAACVTNNQVSMDWATKIN